MSRIEVVALSQAQRAELAVYGARWERCGSATAPPDHAGALRVRCTRPTPPRVCVLRATSFGRQSPADLAAGWAKRRAVAGDNVRALVVDVVRRKAELAVDRAIALSVRMALAGEPGLARAPAFCASIDEAVLRLGERALPILRARFARFLPRPRGHRLSFAASSFSLLSAPWLGALRIPARRVRVGRQTEGGGGAVGARPQSPAGWCRTRRSAGSWIRRPTLLRHDANGRLHAADGPALRYGEACSGLRLEGHHRARLADRAARAHRCAQPSRPRTTRRSGAA